MLLVLGASNDAEARPAHNCPCLEGEHSRDGHPALEHTGMDTLRLMGTVSP